MRDKVCNFDLEGLHVQIEYIYYDYPYDCPTSYVAAIWTIGTRKALAQRSFGNQASAERWVLKQLEHSSFVILAEKVID